MAAHPVSESSKLYEDIPDEVFESNITSEDEVWQMFFDGVSRIGPKGRTIAGVGVVLISPQNHVLPRAFSLTESCSNNVAEYNALLIGLQLAHGMGVRYLEAYGDSKLIINQIKGELRSVTKIWCLIITQSSNWLICLKASISGTCLDLKTPRQTLLLH